MPVDHNNPEEPSQRHRRERTKEEMGNRQKAKRTRAIYPRSDNLEED